MQNRFARPMARRQRRIARRLDRKHIPVERERPVFPADGSHDQRAERARGLAAGGRGAMQLWVEHVGRAESVGQSVPVPRRHRPSHASDHVLTITSHLLAGGTRLEHIELRRNDEVFLDALGVQRVPDPATAHDGRRLLPAARLREHSAQPRRRGRVRVFADCLPQDVLPACRAEESVGRRGPRVLFSDVRYFFHLTNDWETPADPLVLTSNRRCGQEKLVAQLKNEVCALRAPLDTLERNWADMVLAWTLKVWPALLLPETGRWREKHGREKRTVLKMEFSTFCHAFRQWPCQIIQSGRRRICRLLSGNPWQHVFLRLAERCAGRRLC